jgi:hypothetical protein
MKNKTKTHPGVANQLMEANSSPYKKLTVESIEEMLKTLEANNEPDPTPPPWGYVGNGLYSLGSGAYCNEKGFEDFKKELSSFIASKSL